MNPQETREPGISSWIPRAVLQELESRGIPADPLLARHGLTRERLLDPGAWIPIARHDAFHRDAVAASGDPTFALAAGRHVPLHVTHLVGLCAAVSADLGGAFEAWSRLSALIVDDTRFGTRRTGRFDAIFWARPPSLLPLHESGPGFAMAVLGFLEFAIGRSVKPLEVLLTGPEPAATRPFVEALGGPVRWGAKNFEIRLPPGTFDVPVRFADAKTRAALEERAGRELARRARGGARDEVREAIHRSGLGHAATVSEVARLLGMTARTLQRRLADESLSFSDVRDELLRDAAAEMLASGDASVVEVARRLGFCSPSGFRRASRRWREEGPAAAGTDG